jgi:hypothetical protein
MELLVASLLLVSRPGGMGEEQAGDGMNANQERPAIATDMSSALDSYP